MASIGLRRFPLATLRCPWTDAFVWRLVSTVGGVVGFFFLLAHGFGCRLFCDILVDQSLLETALSPCYGHLFVFILSFAFIIGVAFCVCRRLTERSLGWMLPSHHFWLLKFFLHTKEVCSPGPSNVLAWSLLSLRCVLMHLLLFRSEFQGLRGGLASPPSS